MTKPVVRQMIDLALELFSLSEEEFNVWIKSSHHRGQRIRQLVCLLALERGVGIRELGRQLGRDRTAIRNAKAKALKRLQSREEWSNDWIALNEEWDYAQVETRRAA